LEIFALAHCGRELFLVMDIVKEVCKVVTNWQNTQTIACKPSLWILMHRMDDFGWSWRESGRSLRSRRNTNLKRFHDLNHVCAHLPSLPPISWTRHEIFRIHPGYEPKVAHEIKYFELGQHKIFRALCNFT
jgi:hypothetical protein